MQEDKRLRPSQAFVYLALDEIPPDAYPEFAIEEVRRECRKAYRARRRDRLGLGGGRILGDAVAAVLAGLIQLVILNEHFRHASRISVESGMALDRVPPRHVAFLRVLG